MISKVMMISSSWGVIVKPRRNKMKIEHTNNYWCFSLQRSPASRTSKPTTKEPSCRANTPQTKPLATLQLCMVMPCCLLFEYITAVFLICFCFNSQALGDFPVFKLMTWGDFPALSLIWSRMKQIGLVPKHSSKHGSMKSSSVPGCSKMKKRR